MNENKKKGNGNESVLNTRNLVTMITNAVTAALNAFFPAPQNLENCKDSHSEDISKSEEADMSKRIRHKLRICGEERWVTASTMQQFADRYYELKLRALGLAPESLTPVTISALNALSGLSASGLSTVGIAPVGLAPVGLNADSLSPQGLTPVGLSANSLSATQTRPKHKFSEYASQWFETYVKPTRAVATSRSYRVLLDAHLNPSLGEKYVEDISTVDCQAMFNNMDGLAKTSKEKTRAVLNMILEQAIEDGLIEKNPLKSSSIRIVGKASESTVPYSVEQMRYLAHHIDDLTHERDKAFLALSLCCPLRLEETLGLKGMDMDGMIIHVRRAVAHPNGVNGVEKETKTRGSVRDLNFPEEMARYIPKTQPDAYIVTGNTKPISRPEVKAMYKRIGLETGFGESVSGRRFRCTTLTDLYDQTKDLTLTAKAAGHTNTSTTMKHYVKGRLEGTNTATPIAALYGVDLNTQTHEQN